MAKNGKKHTSPAREGFKQAFWQLAEELPELIQELEPKEKVALFKDLAPYFITKAGFGDADRRRRLEVWEDTPKEEKNYFEEEHLAY